MGSDGPTQPPQEVAVVMVAFPLQGHLNQLLHLSRLISAHNVAVHFVGTETHNHLALRRVHGWEPLSISNIYFHDFPSLSVTTLEPDPNSEIKFPSHQQPLFDSLSNLRQPFNELLQDLSPGKRRMVIVYDSLMGSVIQDFVKFPNAESYAFHSVSAFMMFFFLWGRTGKPFPVDANMLKNLPTMEGCFSPDFTNYIGNQHEFLNLCSGRIYNTCRAIEGSFLELLARPEIIGKQKQWALGPFNPVNKNRNSTLESVMTVKKELSSSTLSLSSDSSNKCMEWLDRQASNSVVLVSFGTTTTFTDEQTKELAIGLEESGVHFIWVLRGADAGVNGEFTVQKAQLPNGFENRVQERGIILRDWAPQLEILGHFATGGFLSHCGWNSCMESMSMGVPIAAWPMHSDQPRNTVLITEVLKIGVVVKEWSRRNEIVKASIVATALKRLMESKEGEEIRFRASELGTTVRSAVAEGGATWKEFQSLISYITR